MRSSRKAILAASIGAVLVACGLEVTGIDPIPDRGPDSGADTSVSAHPDATLIAAGLPRAEVEEGLKQLLARSNSRQ